MLTTKEKRESSRLLEKLANDELRSLKDTITRKQIAVENRQEAIKAIIEYSQSADELLRRRKLRRDVLFRYLADCNVVVPVNSEKHVLVAAILRHWGSRIPAHGNLRDIESGTNLAAAASQTDSANAGAASASSQTPPYRHFGTSATDVNNSQTVENVPSGQNQVRVSGSDINPEHQALGETFVTWFYKLLNSHNPSMPRTGEDFGPQHFWQDCTLKLTSVTPEPSEDSFDGSALVSQRLLALAREEHLLFNPNVSKEGVKVKSDPHGLVIIMVCGTIHQHNSCLGVFQQMFGLVCDPRFDNNWKIKVTHLRLVSSRVTAIPKLTDSSDADLLSLEGSASSLALTRNI